MNRYERIRYGGKTLILRNTHETYVLGEKVLRGIEVDREGVEVAERGVDERMHLIALSLITKRTPLVMDKTYGELVPAPTQANVPGEPDHW